MKTWLVGAFTLTVIGAAAWWMISSHNGRISLSGDAEHSPTALSGANPTQLSSQAVLDIRPGTQAGTPHASTPLPKPPLSALGALFYERRDYAAVLEAAERLPNDAEALRLRAQTLELCARVTGTEFNRLVDENLNEAEAQKYDEAARKLSAKREQTQGKRDPRAEFIASLDPAHPDTSPRIAAYDRIRERRKNSVSAKADPCASILNQKISRTELQALWDRAERLGDGYALARNFYCSFQPEDRLGSSQQTADQIAEDMEARGRRARMDDARLAALKVMLAERDPSKMDVLVSLFGKQFTNGHLYIESPTIRSSRARFGARLLEQVKCDLAGGCAEKNAAELDDACANRGHCAATSMEDYLRYYVLPPVRAQDLEQQRQQFREMFASGDFSALRLAKARRAENEEEEEYGSAFFWNDYAATIWCSN